MRICSRFPLNSFELLRNLAYSRICVFAYLHIRCVFAAYFCKLLHIRRVFSQTLAYLPAYSHNFLRTLVNSCIFLRTRSLILVCLSHVLANFMRTLTNSRVFPPYPRNLLSGPFPRTLFPARHAPRAILRAPFPVCYSPRAIPRTPFPAHTIPRTPFPAPLGSKTTSLPPAS